MRATTTAGTITFAAALSLLTFAHHITVVVSAQQQQAVTSCAFLPDAPVVESFLPSLQYAINFVNVEAKIYRHPLSDVGYPRIRVLRYSSIPVISIDDDEKKIIIAVDNKCTEMASSASPSNPRKSSHLTFFTSVTTALFLAVNNNNNAASTTTAAAAAAAAMLLGILTFNHETIIASAHTVDDDDDDDGGCRPTMEVVLEAPPYYLGSVDECRAAVTTTNPEHCPNDFPVFPTCSSEDPSSFCKVVVVGAGTGGAYAAMRLLDEGVYEGRDVCVFEATERVGGRLYSLRGFGPDGMLTVDAGGYRTWPEYTPTTHALITETLGLQVECYEDEIPCQKYNIVGNDGEKVGFATFVEEMMNRIISKGVCFYPRHELTSIRYDENKSLTKNTLYFSNGIIVRDVEEVILNIPQRSLLKVLRKSNIPFVGKNEDEQIYDALHAVQTEIVTKVYLYYDDAWWYRLGLTNGDFSHPGDARNMLLEGRYHDGHVKCSTTPDDDNNNNCHGFLLAVYAHDFGGTKSQYFRRYQRDRPEPVTIISNTDAEGRLFLEHAHARLKEYHLYERNNDANNASYYTGFEAQKVFDSTKPPTHAVLATWNTHTFGAGGGWHHWTDVSNVERATKPLNSYNIHVINEAFSKLQGWAEGSLLLADEVLEEFFNVDRPWEFEAPDYVQWVAQTSSRECNEGGDDDAAESGGGGGGGGGASGGGSATAGGIDLCFAGDAMVTMADGSLRSLSEIRKGDVIFTGFYSSSADDDGSSSSSINGLVTDVLVHKIVLPHGGREATKPLPVAVAVINTPQGELVGTPSHPIYIDGRWVEINNAVVEGGDSSRGGLLKDYGYTTLFEYRDDVHVLYNLEIDGHSPGKSAHSYVANGIIASGLGDNVELNMRFARQDHWKENV